MKETIELPSEFHPAVKAELEINENDEIIKTVILDHEGDELFSQDCSPKHLRDTIEDVFLSDVGAWLEENYREFVY